MSKISSKLAATRMKLAKPVQNERIMTLCIAGTYPNENLIELLSNKGQ